MLCLPAAFALPLHAQEAPAQQTPAQEVVPAQEVAPAQEVPAVQAPTQVAPAQEQPADDVAEANEIPADLLDEAHMREELGVNEFTAPSISKLFDTL